ncbi:hypothetical protein VINI7043_18958 [Vibrio nigripulchritudo ATCC 27043]|nr:hypothetical protein VINI7043_18958 [Vibrio nigripulchritudo ATCC 27043]
MFKKCFLVLSASYPISGTADIISLSPNPNKVAPAVSGQLFENQQPVPGATVVRTITTNRTIVEIVKTDKNGYFKFTPFHYDFPIQTKSSDTIRSMINITAEYGKNSKAIWSSEHAGSHYLPFMPPAMKDLSCDMNESVNLYEFSSGYQQILPTRVTSICQLSRE